MAAIQSLKSNKYTITNHDTKGAGSTDIEAENNTSKVLVQVKPGVAPNEPADLSPDELRNIKARATKLKRDAYCCKVQLEKDSSGKLKQKSAKWIKLN